MKKSKKSTLTLSLAALAVVGCLSGCRVSKMDVDPETTKVLMIGNSFSISVLRHLPKVAEKGGVKLDLASLYIGGCSLATHWANAQRDGEPDYRPYRYDRIVEGARVADGARRNVCEVLRQAKWDIVTLQQASHASWQPDSYRPAGDELVALVRRLAPQAKIYVQETWSYTPWDKRLKKWGFGQDEMYARLHAAYADFAARNGLKVIPFGTAVQEWRRRRPVTYTENSFGGDVVGGGRQEPRDHFRRNARNEWEPNSDVFHLGRTGEYFQALVWAKSLLGVDLDKVDCTPAFVTDDEAALMKKIAGEVR